VLAGVPSPNQGALHQPTLIERYLTFASVGLYIVELAFVEPLLNLDTICLDVTPAQRQHLSNAERTEHNQYDDRLRDVLESAHNRERERQVALDRLSRNAFESGLYQKNKFPEGGQDE
jgi:hypothetical protein